MESLRHIGPLLRKSKEHFSPRAHKRCTRVTNQEKCGALPASTALSNRRAQSQSPKKALAPSSCLRFLAHPPKDRRPQRARRLTSPSSGPAYGRPLMSNVRRRTSHTPKISASSKSLRPCPEPAQDQSHQAREPIEITSAAAMCHIEPLLMKSLPRRCARWSARSRACTLGVPQEQFGARLSLTALPNHRAQ